MLHQIHTIIRDRPGIFPAGGSAASGAACRRRAERLRGFTLIELLVVVVLVAGLATLGFTVYAKARVSATKAECASNMRQLGMGLLGYAGENHGRLPGTQHFQAHGSTESWVFALQDYFDGDIDKIRICPADPKGSERAKNHGSSYVLNDFLDSGATDIFGNRVPGQGSLNSLRNPSRTMMLFVISDRKGTGTGNDHIHGQGWRSWPRVLADIQPDRHRGGSANADHTHGSANYLYVDGRVESIEASEIKARTDRGINIAKPPN